MDQNTVATRLIQSHAKSQSGFTYFGTLFIVTIIGLALSGASVVWRIQLQREKEKELIFIGEQYINAIASYYNTSNGDAKHYPEKLEYLVKDPRATILKRHIRKLWKDPLTNKSDWGIIKAADNGIAGIYSKAKGKPIKKNGFGSLESLLANKTSYSEWQFIYIVKKRKRNDALSIHIPNRSNVNNTSY